MIQKVVRYLKDVRGELNQVSWSPMPELWASTKVVLAAVAFVASAIYIFDLVCAQFMQWIIR